MKDFKDLGFEEDKKDPFSDLGFQSISEEPKEQPEASKTGVLGTIAAPFMGAAEGATLGHSAEIGSAIAAPFIAAKRTFLPSEDDQKLAELEKQGFQFPDKPKTNVLDVYRELQQNSEGYAKDVKKENPWLYGVPELAGGFALPGIGAAKGIATGVSTAAKLAKAAKLGAGMGAVAGAGYSEGNIEQEPGKLLKDTGTGALVGGLLGPVMEVAAPYVIKPVSNAWQKIKDWSYRKAGKGGQTMVDAEKFAKEGHEIIGDTPEKYKQLENISANELAPVGRALLEEAQRLHNVPINNPGKINATEQIDSYITQAEKMIERGLADDELKRVEGILAKLKGKRDEFLAEGVNKEALNAPVKSEAQRLLEQKQKEEILLAQRYNPDKAQIALGAKVANANTGIAPAVGFEQQTKNIRIPENFQDYTLHKANADVITPKGIQSKTFQQLEKPIVSQPIEEVIPGKLSYGPNPSQQMSYRPDVTHNQYEMTRQEFRNLIKDLDNQISTAPKGIKSELIEMRKKAGEFLESKMTPEERIAFKKSNEMYVDKYDLEDIFGPEIFKSKLQDSDLKAITDKLSDLHSYGGKSSDKAISSFNKGIEILQKYYPEKAKQISDLAQKHSKLWALSTAGQATSPSNITGSFQSLLLRGAATSGFLKRKVSGAIAPVQDLINWPAERLLTKATELERAGKTTQANFLRNFNNADVSKKKALMFSASQNPELRDVFGVGYETSEGNE
jgi:hypothetical protein